jgi:putative PIN family toxin of toxin-antitoxin system
LKPFGTGVVRAVLDSSVLISGFLTPHGVSARLLNATEEQRFELCTSHEILEETRRSLTTKVRRIRRYYAYPDDKIDLFIEGLGADSEVVSDLPAIRAVPLDPTDDVIVATAIKAQADFIVTGDRHLLALGAHQGIQIVTPRQFLDLLR